MKKFTFLIFCLIIGAMAYAQNTIVGNVSNKDNKPIPDVAISVKDTNVSTISDKNGNYTIDVPEGYKTLSFNKKGFKVQEVDINSNIVNITMSSEKTDIFELSLEELLDIEIASLLESSIKKQPATVTVVTNEQLRMSGARLLSEALMMYVPGLFVVEDQDDIITGVRGLAPDVNSKLMVLLNGTNMNIEWFWGAPHNILNSINFDWVERVEVIRGPGSVTYGQGALIGVINIVTRDGSFNSSSVRTRVGKDNDLQTSYEIGAQTDDIDYYFNLSLANYDGQDMKEEGWGLRGYGGAAGGTIADQNPKVRNGENATAMAIVNHKKTGLAFNFFYFDQTNDLYNFWVDRNVFQHRMISGSVEHAYEFNEKIKIVSSAAYMRDDYRLAMNTTDFTTGGGREDRINLKTRLHLNEVFISGLNMVMGVDFRNIESGRLNSHGDNFLLDILDTPTLSTYDQINEERTFINRSTTNITGIFWEGLYSQEMFSVFTSLRYDNHPNWGSHLSTRAGAIVSPFSETNIRFTYQNGFRGAVGMTYNGGFKRNGFLDKSKFNQIEASLGFPNLGEIQPEEMHSFEVQVDQKLTEALSFNVVGYYNIINHVLDFGALVPTGWPGSFTPFPNVGDVPAGDWGGFWFFKNNKGQVSLAGFEAMLSYDSEIASANVSHSFVTVTSVDEENKLGSMYVTPSEKVKVFPENMTKFNFVFKGLKNTRVALTSLYHYNWYSPADNDLESNLMVNLSASYKFFSKLTLSGTVKNVLDDDKLYPMNNPSGADLIDGTPVYEGRTFWMSLRYEF